jgi:hypothetical protein
VPSRTNTLPQRLTSNRKSMMTRSLRDASKGNAQYQSFVPEPYSRPCTGEFWRVRLLRDELTGEHCIEFQGVRLDETPLKLTIPAALRSEPMAVLRTLHGAGARLPNDRKIALKFIDKLIRSCPHRSVILTVKPGFRHGATGFVMPRRQGVVGRRGGPCRPHPARG